MGSTFQSDSPQELLDNYSDNNIPTTGMREFTYSSTRIWFNFLKDLYCIPANLTFDLGNEDVYPLQNSKCWSYVIKQMDGQGTDPMYDINNKPIKLNVHFIGSVSSPHYDQGAYLMMTALDNAVFYVSSLQYPVNNVTKIFLKKDGAKDSDEQTIIWDGYSDFTTSQGTYSLSEISSEFAAMFDISFQVRENYWEFQPWI